jgi:hypothetical protein
MPAILTDWKALVTLARTGDLNAIGSALYTALGLVGDVTAGTVSASKALVVNSSKQLNDLRATVTSYASTGTTIANCSIAVLASTSTAAVAYAMAAPAAGVKATLVQTATSTFGFTVTLASGTFDGTNHIATFNGAKDVLDLVGLSTAQYAIRGNVGSVALSTS